MLFLDARVWRRYVGLWYRLVLHVFLVGTHEMRIFVGCRRWNMDWNQNQRREYFAACLNF